MDAPYRTNKYAYLCNLLDFIVIASDLKAVSPCDFIITLYFFVDEWTDADDHTDLVQGPRGWLLVLVLEIFTLLCQLLLRLIRRI